MRRGLLGLIVVVGLVGCGSSNHSATLVDSIKTKGAQQLQTNLQNLGSSGTVKVDDASCARQGNTQNYTCTAHYTVNDPAHGLNNQKYLLDVAGTCTSSKCSWHSTGKGIPVR